MPDNDDTVYVAFPDGYKNLRVELPDRIGYVEISTGNVHGPTGFPVIGVDAVSETKDTPAADGRIYEPARDRDCGVVLVGRPGPRLLEQERQIKWFEKIIKKHDSGDHSECPETCPAKEELTMGYVLTVIHPPVAPACYGNAETLGPFADKLKAVQRVTYIVAVKHDMPGKPAAAFAGALRNEPDGTERAEPMTGLTFRIDPADNAPHPCPCGEGESNTCGRLVLPDDHADAHMEDAYCTGCFTWNRGDVQCLSANTAHTEEF